MDAILKYENFTLADMEEVFEYCKGKVCFVCDGDLKFMIMEENDGRI